MRDILIEHLDGKRVPYIVRAKSRSFEDCHNSMGRHPTLRSAVSRGLLRVTGSPPHTVMTESGREALSKTLADWADALIRAGYGEGFLGGSSWPKA